MKIDLSQKMLMVKQKMKKALELCLCLSATFVSMHCNAQNNNKAVTVDFQKPYFAGSHFDTLYKDAKREFEFKGHTKQDFEVWHAAFLPHLKNALGLDKMEQELAGFVPHAEKTGSEDLGYCTREHWIIWTEPTVPLPCVVLIPKSKKGKLPLIIATHGHGRNSEQYTGIYPENVVAMQAVNEGYITIAPTIRAFGSTRTEYDKQNDISFSCHTQLMRDLLVGRTPIGERVWDMCRILDWAILNLPVDQRKIAITGNSGGGTVSLFTAACEPRITVAVPSSYFCTFQGSIGTIPHCDCNYIPGILALGEMGDVAGLIAPRPFCALHGVKDAIFPIDETRKAFNHLKEIYAAAGAPGNCALFEGAEGHQYYKEGSWPFISKEFGKQVQ
ncbi:MAG: acetylxylan esterase [Ginsengibacter sp.]